MVGPMHYLQVAPVCRAWNADYRWQFDKRTSHRSVTASVSLLQWAIRQGCLGMRRSHRSFCARMHACKTDPDPVYGIFFRFPQWVGVAVWHGTCGVQALHHAAAFTGRLDVLERVLGTYHPACAPPDERTCAYAALGGQLALLQALRAQGCPWDVFTCGFAARAGHVHVLQWAIANCCPYDNAITFSCAAACGQLHVLWWLAANDRHPNESTCCAAAHSGQLHVLRWLFMQGCAWDASTAEAAARNGHLECLQWVVLHGCLWNANRCRMEATSSEMRTWIRRQQNAERHAPY
eukprot:TRINITY_DN2160_c1_g1_i5.p1 TRINITY_DN2160_c1_g1~~TRINITY_DN2160_c1_g1_i5.p1  ORF type:complete len:292 (+),score=55.44 TRINITY_DN2160_c1_g1_i5:364-1239(+)